MQPEDNWNELNKGTDEVLSSLISNAKFASHHSAHPLQLLRRNLITHIIWGVLICLVYCFIIAWYHIWQVQAAIAVVFIFSVWALVSSCKLYKNIPTAVSANNMLAELKVQCSSIKKWSIVQQKVALFIYPISASGGFMLGGFLGSGKPVNEFMSKPFMWLILLITVAILVPLCYLLARWITNYSFGKHIKQLERHIQELQKEI